MFASDSASADIVRVLNYIYLYASLIIMVIIYSTHFYSAIML